MMITEIIGGIFFVGQIAFNRVLYNHALSALTDV